MLEILSLFFEYHDEVDDADTLDLWFCVQCTYTCAERLGLDIALSVALALWICCGINW